MWRLPDKAFAFFQFGDASETEAFFELSDAVEFGG
jgi:hypothetical protein